MIFYLIMLLIYLLSFLAGFFNRRNWMGVNIMLYVAVILAAVVSWGLMWTCVICLGQKLLVFFILYALIVIVGYKVYITAYNFHQKPTISTD